MRRLVLLCLGLTTALAQNVAPNSDQPANLTPDTTIRVTVNLIQVDAEVTDSKGKPVTDLKAADFEILQDGKPQTITNLSYITVSPGTSLPLPLTTDAKGVPLSPPARLKVGNVQRTIALVVDDLGLSFEGTAYVRQALKKFVDRQIQPGDLVAIIRTGAGIGALQQFTTDKRLLHVAIDRIRFNPLGRMGSFEPLESTLGPQGSNRMAVENADFDESRQEAFEVGTLGAIRYVVSGLRELPGRKSAVLFSESMQILHGNGTNARILEGLQHITDAADRASVVIYGIDPRGLETYQLTAADDTSGMSAQQVSQIPINRAMQSFNSTQGMEILASQTGGLFIHNTNDIEAALRRVVDDSESYYLIGYHPDISTFNRKTGRPQFRKLQVLVKRPHLHVRSRSGFFGMSDSEQQSIQHTRESQLKRAVFSPFDSGSIHVRLTTLFRIVPKLGSVLDSMLHIDAHDIQFKNEPDGSHKAVLDLLAITFGDNGQAVDSDFRRFTLQMKDTEYRRTLRDGVIYVHRYPIRKPGAYQFRIALQDTASEQIGSANQFIEVPDLKKGRLTLSSLLLKQDAPQHAAPTSEQSAEPVESDPNRTAAIRTFKPGASLTYTYQVLNARTESSRPPNLEVQSRLFREGQQIYAGTPVPLNMTGQPDFKRLTAGGNRTTRRQNDTGRLRAATNRDR